MRYKYIDFKQIVEKVNTGADAIKRAPIVDYDTGIKCIRIQDISQNKDFHNWGYTKIKESDYTRFVLMKDYILIARTGETIGKNCIILKDLKAVYNNGLIRVIINKSKCFPLYMHHILQSIVFSGFVDNYFRSTSTQPNMKIDDLLKFPLPLPPLPTQCKIAAILSAYNDLIGNNNRRIAILQEMAEELYREWFVRLRFPGYEKVKTIKGVPEGWEVTQIQNVCKVARGSSPRPINDNKYFSNGTIPWIKIADATASKMFIYETKEYVNDYGASFSRKLSKGSLIIATSGTLGFCIFLGVEGCVHDGWMYLSEYKNQVKPIFLYYIINYYREHLNNLSYGAAIQNINTEIIRQLTLLLPSDEVLASFYSIVEPLHEKINILGKVNNSLTTSRDHLLSRLMSGKIDVENFDIHFPKSVQEEVTAYA